jgi:hypothetical protein
MYAQNQKTGKPNNLKVFKNKYIQGPKLSNHLLPSELVFNVTLIHLKFYLHIII